MEITSRALCKGVEYALDTLPSLILPSKAQ